MVEEKEIVNTDRMYISIDDTLYSVRPYVEGAKMDKGIAYIYLDRVYIYAGKLNKKDILEPGKCYRMSDNIIKFVAPEEPDMCKYSIENIVHIKVTELPEVIQEDDIKEIDAELLTLNESSIFAPKINPEDDIFKRVVKEVLAHKKINIRLHKDKFKNEYDATNMKAAINKSSNMSIKYLVKWCEILDIDLSVHAKFKDADGVDQEIDVHLR